MRFTLYLFYFISLFHLSTHASANAATLMEEVKFTNEELQAALTLIRPDRCVIEVNGRVARFVPAPSLKFMGIEPAEKRLDLSFIANLIDLRFDNLQADIPRIFFKPDELQVVIPIRDNPRALRSLLGSISFEGVSLVATLGWAGDSAGHQMLSLSQVEIKGRVSGKGVLATKVILGKLKQFAEKNFREAVVKFLEGEKIQSAIEKGLLTYAEFQLGDATRLIIPSSLHFFSEGDLSGVKYSVE